MYCDEVKYTASRIAHFSLPYMHDRAFVESVFGRDNDMYDCYSQCVRDLIRCRALGIPAAIDFMPFYGNRNGAHYWITHIVPGDVVQTSLTGERKAPKVYRYTYARNDVYERVGGEYIPELFRDPFIRDVTDMYVNTRDVSIRDRRKSGPRRSFAYLCVFNNLEWQPVAISGLKRGQAEFDRVGEGIVYLPAVYGDGRVAAIDYPFILHVDGRKESLVPDTTSLHKVRLNRKYPSNLSVNDFVAQVDSSRWVASNDPDFAQADTLFVYHVSKNEIATQINSDVAAAGYRYWKFMPCRQYSLIAEFMFFDGDGERMNVAMGGNDAALFDDDVLTSTTLYGNLVVDIGVETQVSKIVCIPRSDGNGIIPGDYYELLYCDIDGWRSLGCVEAADCHLEYDNVPAGCLLWLRNLTTGVEERVFTCEDGNIRFW
jgi:hypothetical protein